MRTSNEPGTTPSILIRGRSSLNFSNQPLIVVDGIPLTGGDLSQFNSGDIKSLQILKDASSTAIYGARGANGVILITTKRGSVGKATVSYEGYYGFSKPYEQVDMMDADQWVAMRQESERAANGLATIPSIVDALEAEQYEAYQAGINTNFQDLVYQNGAQQNHQIRVAGGTEQVKYNVSMSYFKQEGILKNVDYDRVTMRVNLDFKITDKLKFGISQQMSLANKDNVTDPLAFIFRNSPLTRPYEDDGVTPTTDPLSDGLLWNPLNDFVSANYIDNNKKFRYFANIFASYQITDNLKYTLNVGPDLQFDRDNDYRGTLATTHKGGNNSARKSTRATTSITIENIVNYNKTFGDDHVLNAIGLFSVQDIKEEYNRTSVSAVPSESQTFNSLGDAEFIDGVESFLNIESWMSFMARFNYAYKDKYLVTLTGRYDGSSKLSEGNKWGFFPSASVAWKIIEEDFLKDSDVISDLKLRVGYGTVGRNPIAPYATQGGLRRTEGSYNDNAAYGYRPSAIANPDLKWEITTTFDVGVDFAFLDNRINGSLDYYIGNTTDLLLNRTIPYTSGFSSVLENVGESKNSGIELTLSTINVENDNFTWRTDFNFSRNRSEIVSLLNSEDDDIGNRWFIGEQLGVYYDRVFDGIWQTGEAAEAATHSREPGEIKLADINEDGILNDDDRKIIGYQDPQWIAGLTSTMNYKNIDFSFSIYTRQGHMTTSNMIGSFNTLFGRYGNIDVNYWTPENASNTTPRPNANQERPLDSQVLSYIDASYVRVRNISFGYNFDDLEISNLGISNLRVYVNAQNPFLFTSKDLIDGIDPDLAARGNYLPSPSTFIFGLSATF